MHATVFAHPPVEPKPAIFPFSRDGLLDILLGAYLNLVARTQPQAFARRPFLESRLETGITNTSSQALEPVRLGR